MDTNGGGDALRQQEGYEFMAAAFEVYNDLGSGFLEDVYQESLELELTSRGIAFTSKPQLQLFYKGATLKKRYEADLLLSGEIVVELKAARTLAPEHEAQLINYLKAAKKKVGYLVNFGAFPRLQWKRFVL